MPEPTDLVNPLILADPLGQGDPGVRPAPPRPALPEVERRRKLAGRTDVLGRRHGDRWRSPRKTLQSSQAKMFLRSITRSQRRSSSSNLRRTEENPKV